MTDDSMLGGDSSRRSISLRTIIIVTLVVLGVGLLLWKGLSQASVYFHTADEALAMRQQLEGKRFRIEGTVVPGSISQDGNATLFRIESRGSEVVVRNTGQPNGVFQEKIPVVAEGAFRRGTNTFESDVIMVRHSEQYVEKYPDRVTTLPSEHTSSSQ